MARKLLVTVVLVGLIGVSVLIVAWAAGEDSPDTAPPPPGDTVATFIPIVFESYRSGNEDLWTKDLAGSTAPTKFISHPANDIHPACSKDGSKVAFASDRVGNFEIYSCNPDGTGLKRLTNASNYDTFPCWGSNDTRIVFSREMSEYTSRLVIMNADGTNTKPLTSGNAKDVEPDWSPVAPWIAFVRGSHIFKIKSDGTGLKQLTSGASENLNPAWSPDGKLIAFDSNRDGGSEIYTMKPDGSGVTRLTQNSAYDVEPTWYGSGNRIAFASDRLAGVFHIFTMDADGSNQVARTGGTKADKHPDYR
jgi:TolB protein